MLRLATIGLRTRKLRAALSALGIAIGIASLVAVLAISASSKADLLATIEPARHEPAHRRPRRSRCSAKKPNCRRRRRRGSACSARSSRPARSTLVDGVTVRRNSYVPAEDDRRDRRAGRRLEPARRRSRASCAPGASSTAASERYPAIVLGAKAAAAARHRRLGGIAQVYISGRLFTVVGILEPLPLAPEIDSSALIGYPVGGRLFGIDAQPLADLRAQPRRRGEVRRAGALLPAPPIPADPEEVAVSRPSDALEAQAAAEGAFTSLLLGLGAVALLVGGIGVANVMIISVLERRCEIGLRRALGASRRHIAMQFLAESFVLGVAGGAAGVLLGAAATGAYAAYEGLELLVPPLAVGGGLLAACVLGGLAGLYPALRAARLTPTEALRSV